MQQPGAAACGRQQLTPPTPSVFPARPSPSINNAAHVPGISSSFFFCRQSSPHANPGSSCAGILPRCCHILSPDRQALTHLCPFFSATLQHTLLASHTLVPHSPVRNPPLAPTRCTSPHPITLPLFRHPTLPCWPNHSCNKDKGNNERPPEFLPPLCTAHRLPAQASFTAHHKPWSHAHPFRLSPSPTQYADDQQCLRASLRQLRRGRFLPSRRVGTFRRSQPLLVTPLYVKNFTHLTCRRHLCRAKLHRMDACDVRSGRCSGGERAVVTWRGMRVRTLGFCVQPCFAKLILETLDQLREGCSVTLLIGLSGRRRCRRETPRRIQLAPQATGLNTIASCEPMPASSRLRPAAPAAAAATLQRPLLAPAFRRTAMERAILREDWMRAGERLTTEVFLDSEDISSAVAAEVAALVRRRQEEGGEAPSAGCTPVCSGCLAARKRLHKA